MSNTRIINKYFKLNNIMILVNNLFKVNFNTFVNMTINSENSSIFYSCRKAYLYF